jgi:hypothetical protein
MAKSGGNRRASLRNNPVRKFSSIFAACGSDRRFSVEHSRATRRAASAWTVGAIGDREADGCVCAAAMASAITGSSRSRVWQGRPSVDGKQSLERQLAGIFSGELLRPDAMFPRPVWRGRAIGVFVKGRCQTTRSPGAVLQPMAFARSSRTRIRLMNDRHRRDVGYALKV